MAKVKRPRKNGMMNEQKFNDLKEITNATKPSVTNNKIAGFTGWGAITVKLVRESKDYDEYKRLRSERNTPNTKTKKNAPVDVQQQIAFTQPPSTTDIERNTRALTENTIALRRVIHLLETKKRRIF